MSSCQKESACSSSEVVVSYRIQVESAKQLTWTATKIQEHKCILD